MSRLTYRTLFMRENLGVTKEILEFQKFCITYVTFCKMLKKIDFNKLCTFTSQSCKTNEKKTPAFAAFYLISGLHFIV